MVAIELPPEVTASFVAEARSYLPRIVEALVSLTDQACLADAYRFAHTIKSSAAMMGHVSLSQVAELLEADLEECLLGAQPAAAQLAQLGRSIERIGRLLDAVTGEPVDVDAIVADEVADRTGDLLPEPLAECPAPAIEPEALLVEPPVAEDPVTEQPVTEQPVAEQPVAELALVEQPLIQEPQEEPIIEPAVEPAVKLAIAEPVAEVAASLNDQPAAALDGASIADTADTADTAEVAYDGDGDGSVVVLVDELAEAVLALARAANGEPAAAIQPHREAIRACLTRLDDAIGPDPARGAAEPDVAASIPAGAPAPASAPADWQPVPQPALVELDPDTEREAALRQALEAELRFQIEEEIRAQLAAPSPSRAPAGLFTVLRPAVTSPALSPAAAAPAAVAAEPELSAEDAEMREVFALEAGEHLKRIDADVAALEGATGDGERLELLRSLRRTVHTLKGAAAMMGVDAVAALAHSLEDRLDVASEQGTLLEPAAHAELLRDLDRLESLVNGGTAPGAPDALESAPAAPAEAPQPDAAAGTADTGEPAPAASRPPAMPAAVPVRLEDLDQLLRLAGESSVSVAAWPALLSAANGALSEMRRAVGRVQALLQSIESDRQQGFEPAPAGSAASGPPAAGLGTAAAFDALELDRYTAADYVAHELAEIAADALSVEREIASSLESAGELVTAQRHQSAEMLDRLLAARLVPLEELGGRLQRATRGVALRRSKDVRFHFEGGQVAIDRAILDSVADALIHLVRNAADHGVEAPEVRLRAGKPAAGTVWLRAAQEQGEVRIEVGDDGAGIDVQRLLRAGRAAGLDVDDLDPQQALDLMFRPGVSTAGQVDDVSGRGVGLDAVRDAIGRVRGTIEVASEPGQGTTFSLRFPVTLAQARVVMAEVAGGPVAVPAASVRRVARLHDVSTERFGGQPIARLDGEAYPLSSLAGVLGMEEEPTGPADPPVLFVESAGRRAALVAREVGTHQEVVVKPTGSHLSALRGVAGATMLQDGRVALLLHLPDLLEAAWRPAQRAVRQVTREVLAAPRRAGGDTPLSVLVVDDSPTIRKLLVRTLKDLGWGTVEAKDGAEALERIRLARPDVVLADIEMPRMDGYSLLAALRGRPDTASLPVVMLTSRTADRHRRQAMELGANGYLTKPYRPADVVAALREFGLPAPAHAVA